MEKKHGLRKARTSDLDVCADNLFVTNPEEIGLETKEI